MLERGGFSFVALLVINPVVILLYQNCTFLPVTHSELASQEMQPQKRVISSLASPERAEIPKLKVVQAALLGCDSSKQNCLVADIE